jgi:hypothetical protein
VVQLEVAKGDIICKSDIEGKFEGKIKSCQVLNLKIEETGIHGEIVVKKTFLA